MGRTVVLVTAGVAVAALAGIGLYARNAANCRGLEEDYLNAVSSLRNSGSIRAVLGEKGDEAADLIERNATTKLETLTERLYEECGERAAQTASRKGSDLLLGS